MIYVSVCSCLWYVLFHDIPDTDSSQTYILVYPIHLSQTAVRFYRFRRQPDWIVLDFTFMSYERDCLLKLLNIWLVLLHSIQANQITVYQIQIDKFCIFYSSSTLRQIRFWRRVKVSHKHTHKTRRLYVVVSIRLWVHTHSPPGGRPKWLPQLIFKLMAEIEAFLIFSNSIYFSSCNYHPMAATTDETFSITYCGWHDRIHPFIFHFEALVLDSLFIKIHNLIL